MLFRSNSCTTTLSAIITQPGNALSSVISSQSDVDCYANSTGIVTINGVGGTSPYLYSSDGVNFDLNNTFNGLSAGNYSITIKDANGCLAIQGVLIAQPSAALTSSVISLTNVDCSGNATGSISVEGSGGTIPYIYSINGINFVP